VTRSRSFNVLDALDFFRRHALRVAVWLVAMGVAGYVVSLVIPPVYRATATILPPEEDELASSISLARRSLPGFVGLGRLGTTYFTQADVALAILRSRSVHEQVVQHFDLRRRYHVKTNEQAIRQLRDRVKVRLANDGTISVSVEDRNARSAAEIANAFLSELDRYTQRFRSARARRARLFLERRVNESEVALRTAERQLGIYQQRRGTVVLPPETRAAADAAANLMAQKATAEVELELAREYASSRSEVVQQLEARVRELRRQVGSLPAGQIAGANLVREVAIQQQVFALLTAQLEEARIREAMDTSTIQILDIAVPPDHRSWPRRTWIAAFGGLLGALCGIIDARRRTPQLRRGAMAA
jgi:tyrosine-protein kinase Etk/Wzc